MKETQEFLNYFLEGVITPLVVDGIIGRKSNEAISLAIPSLKEKCKKEGLYWDSEFMFIGLRTDNDIDNTFEDWFIVVAYGTLLALPASTVSGSNGIWKYWNRWIRGKTGVGTIKENQQIDYLLVKPNKNNTWSLWTGGLGFLFQDKPIDIYRGAVYNTDSKKWEINKKNLVINDLGGGFNVHSWLGFYGLFVQNLSEGCNVTLEKYWKILFPILISNAKKDRVIYTLLQY